MTTSNWLFILPKRLSKDIIEALPQNIQSFISTHFSGNELEYAIINNYKFTQNESFLCDIWINDKIHPVFDSVASWVRIDCSNQPIPNIILESLPEKLKESLYIHNKYQPIPITVVLPNGVNIMMTIEAEWKEINGYGHPFPKTANTLLPEKAVSYILSTYPEKATTKVICKMTDIILYLPMVRCYLLTMMEITQQWKTLL